jgi:V/A-type H+/Na+-transporting ATPase subunit G/H
MDVLKRLLDAEIKAEAQLEAADRERERVIQEALDEARTMEERFEAGLAEFRAPILKEAEEDARRQTEELERRYAATAQTLRTAAQRNEEAAVAAALSLLLGKSSQS